MIATYMASASMATDGATEDLFFSPAMAREDPGRSALCAFPIRSTGRPATASILHRLAKGDADIPAMVRAIYIGIDPRLTGAAGYSVAGASGRPASRAESWRRMATR